MDVSKYLQPISPDEPCGPNLEYDADFLAMESAAQDKPEQQMGSAVAEGAEADWKTVREKALSLLDRTRDLRVALYLGQAGLHRVGFDGLADGLELSAGFVKAFWDHVHPQLDPDDDNDPIMRMNTIASFCGRDTFLTPIRFVQLVSSRAGQFSLRDIWVAQGKMSLPEGVTEDQKPDPALVDAAFMDADVESLQSTEKSIARCEDQLGELSNACDETFPPGMAPNLDALRKALREVHVVMQEQLARRGVGSDAEAPAGDAAADAAAGAPAAGGAPRPAAPAALPSRLESREQVVRVIDLACDYYARAEPSSPVPVLLKRAKRMVSMEFMDILKELAPTGVKEAEVIRGPDTE